MNNNDTIARAKKEYSTGTQEVKNILKKVFGEDIFQNDWRNIDSFETACKLTGDDPHAQRYEIGSDDNIAYEKIKTIIKAVNGDWTPDFSNSNQYKWSPWFRYDPKISGFRFDVSYYGNVDTLSASGSRLCLETEEKSDYVGKQFIDLYNQFLN